MPTKKGEILAILRENPRQTNAEIAAQIRSDEKEVTTIISELESTGAIVDYTTIIDETKCIDLPQPIQAFVEVTIHPEKGTGFEDIAKRIYKYPNVVSHYLLSGGYDFLILVKGKTHQEIAAFVYDKVATIEQVNSTNTHFIFKKYKDHGCTIEKEDPIKRQAVVA